MRRDPHRKRAVGPAGSRSNASDSALLIGSIREGLLQVSEAPISGATDTRRAGSPSRSARQPRAQRPRNQPTFVRSASTAVCPPISAGSKASSTMVIRAHAQLRDPCPAAAPPLGRRAGSAESPGPRTAPARLRLLPVRRASLLPAAGARGNPFVCLRADADQAAGSMNRDSTVELGKSIRCTSEGAFTCAPHFERPFRMTTDDHARSLGRALQRFERSSTRTSLAAHCLPARKPARR